MIYFLYAWSAHIVCMLEQVKKEVVGRHEQRTDGFRCAKTILMRWASTAQGYLEGVLNTPAAAISVGHHHTGELNN